ncbi:uncharacterized protein LOC122563531 isoform X1 [Chiloscyllium plagiosum]|uniref:uncharacterized protein LOC122563531 isoform X1 n=1 Tax=Chiloscyllium plagiosum TaxID=36176 RepID=UPI001CB80619|nr:uncharacterized protein LOC122563531 isoform X1 [Chiloscyllium plagiosum]
MAGLVTDFYDSKCTTNPNQCKATDSTTWSRIRMENIPNDFTNSICNASPPSSDACLSDKLYSEFVNYFPGMALLIACLVILVSITLFILKRNSIHSLLKILYRNCIDFCKRRCASNKAAEPLSLREIQCLRRGMFAQDRLARRLHLVECKLSAVEDMVIYVVDQVEQQRRLQSENIAPSQSCCCTWCQRSNVSRKEFDSMEYEQQGPVQYPVAQRRKLSAQYR